MKFLTATAAALAVMATQASALSCLPVDPITSFQKAAESEESYFILNGTFNFEPIKMPSLEERSLDTFEPILIISQFEGQVLGAEGFTDYPAFDVALKPVCLGPWCGNMAAGVPTLAFARRLDSGALLVEPDPCGGQTFAEPTPEMIQGIEACATGACPDVPEITPNDG